MNLFQIATEFRFDIGSAVANSSTLQNAVEGISGAAREAQIDFQNLGMSIIANMTGASSLMGLLGAALKASDQFAQSQRDLVNIMMANSHGALSFQTALSGTESIMENINKKAQEFSLPTKDLLTTTKQIGAVLLNAGLDDLSFSKSIDISRQYLKSAPTLGIDPGLAQQQLVRAVMGQASMGDTLFARLSSETAAFGGHGKKITSKEFNTMSAAKRLDLLTKSLSQFSSNMDVVQGNANSLSGQMRILGEALYGPFSILRKVGDAIMPAVTGKLQEVNKYLQTDGQKISKSFGQILKGSVGSLENVFATVMQLSKLKGDVAKAGSILSVLGLVDMLQHFKIIKAIKLPGALGKISDGFKKINLAMETGTIALQAGIIKGASKLPLIGGMLAGFLGSGFVATMSKLTTLVSRFVWPLLLLVTLFQLLSRAAAYASIDALKRYAKMLPRAMEAIAKFKGVLQPLFYAFDYLAKMLSPVFLNILVAVADTLIWLVDSLSTVLMLAQAGFQGLLFAVFEFVMQIKSLFTGGGFSFSRIADAFEAGTNEVFERVLGKVASGKAVSKNNVQIDKIEIKNDFKEGAQPDRIAFTLVDQLNKIAQNPRGGNGRSMAGGFNG